MYKLTQGVDVPKDPYSGALPTLSIEHAEIHAGRMFNTSGVLTVATAQVGSVALTVPNAAAASATIAVSATSNVEYTARGLGRWGNNYKITHVDPDDDDQPLTVSRDGFDVIISLATDGDGTITSTVGEVIAAVNASPDLQLCLKAALGEDGDADDVAVAVVETALTGGIDILEVHFKMASVSVTKGEMTAIFKEDATFTATGTALTPVNRLRVSSNTSQLLLKSNANTTVANGANMVPLDTILLGAASQGNQRITGQARGDEEYVLSRGKNYLLEVTNNSGTTEKVSYYLQWYERTPNGKDLCNGNS